MKGTYRSPASVIVLSVVTCGIYYLYWIYKTETELKFFLGEAANDVQPGLDILLSIICVPYQVYIFYRFGSLIKKSQEQIYMPGEDNSILYLLLSLFGFVFISSAIVQSNLNTVWSHS